MRPLLPLLPRLLLLLLLLWMVLLVVEVVAKAERHRWSEVSERKSGGGGGGAAVLELVEKAEVEKRDEKGFLLLWRERLGKGRLVGRSRPRLRFERMMLSKRAMEVWTGVVEDAVGAGAVYSRSEMNSLKAKEGIQKD